MDSAIVKHPTCLDTKSPSAHASHEKWRGCRVLHGCCSHREHEEGRPLTSQPASEVVQSFGPSRPSSASADEQSEISCFTDESGSLSRVHSNPLYAEEAGAGARQTKSGASTDLPADAHTSREVRPGLESAVTADERVMGALGRVSNTSLKTVRAGLCSVTFRQMQCLLQHAEGMGVLVHTPSATCIYELCMWRCRTAKGVRKHSKT